MADMTTVVVEGVDVGTFAPTSSPTLSPAPTESGDVIDEATVEVIADTTTGVAAASVIVSVAVATNTAATGSSLTTSVAGADSAVRTSGGRGGGGGDLMLLFQMLQFAAITGQLALPSPRSGKAFRTFGASFASFNFQELPFDLSDPWFSKFDRCSGIEVEGDLSTMREYFAVREMGPVETFISNCLIVLGLGVVMKAIYALIVRLLPKVNGMLGESWKDFDAKSFSIDLSEEGEEPNDDVFCSWTLADWSTCKRLDGRLVPPSQPARGRVAVCGTADYLASHEPAALGQKKRDLLREVLDRQEEGAVGVVFVVHTDDKNDEDTSEILQELASSPHDSSGFTKWLQELYEDAYKSVFEALGDKCSPCDCCRSKPQSSRIPVVLVSLNKKDRDVQHWHDFIERGTDGHIHLNKLQGKRVKLGGQAVPIELPSDMALEPLTVLYFFVAYPGLTQSAINVMSMTPGCASWVWFHLALLVLLILNGRLLYLLKQISLPVVYEFVSDERRTQLATSRHLNTASVSPESASSIEQQAEDQRLVFRYHSRKHVKVLGRYSMMREFGDIDTHGTWRPPKTGNGQECHKKFSGLFNKFGPSGKTFYFFEAFYKFLWLILLALGDGLLQSLVGLIFSALRAALIAATLPHNSTSEALYELMIASLQHAVLWFPVLGFLEVLGWGSVSAGMIRCVPLPSCLVCYSQVPLKHELLRLDSLMTGLVGVMVLVNMCPIFGSSFYQSTGLGEMRSIFDSTVGMRTLLNITEEASGEVTAKLRDPRIKPRATNLYSKILRESKGICSEKLAHERACSACFELMGDTKDQVIATLTDAVKKPCMEEFGKRNGCDQLPRLNPCTEVALISPSPQAFQIRVLERSRQPL